MAGKSWDQADDLDQRVAAVLVDAKHAEAERIRLSLIGRDTAAAQRRMTRTAEWKALYRARARSG